MLFKIIQKLKKRKICVIHFSFFRKNLKEKKLGHLIILLDLKKIIKEVIFNNHNSSLI